MAHFHFLLHRLLTSLNPLKHDKGTVLFMKLEDPQIVLK